MAFETSSADALDKLRSDQTVRADSTASISDEIVDTLAQFHKDSKKEEKSTDEEIGSYMKNFEKSKTDRKKLDELIARKRAAQHRNEILSGYVPPEAENPEEAP